MAEAFATTIHRLVQDAELVAFDFDGVIANTEPLHAASYQRLLAERGIDFQVSDFVEYVGQRDDAIYRQLSERFGILLDEETAGARRRELFIDSAVGSGLRPYPFVVPILDLIREKGREAIVVSSQVAYVVEYLLRWWKLWDNFRDVFTVSLSIPGMESKSALLKTLPQRTKHRAHQILLFEDSALLLSVASTLGMRTVGVAHPLANAAAMRADLLITHPQTEWSSGRWQ
jgi:beta-phosphoglucomutase-like phosphatase (HAD superfamily)